MGRGSVSIRPHWLAVFVALAVTALIVSGCTRDEYWENTLPPAPILGVIELPDTTVACKSKLPTLACYDRQTGMIWMQAGMEPQLRLCVIRHEYRHAAGDDHPKFREQGYAIDCGDGTTMPGAIT